MQDANLINQLRARIAEIESNGGVSDASDAARVEVAASSEMTEAHHRSNSGGKRDADETKGANAALKKIIALVNVSDRSEKSVRERLKRYDFDEGAIEESVERAKEYGFIDDARFADILIRSRIAQGRGSSGIERELRENGIQPETVDGWPYEYEVDDSVEIERALAHLERKPPRSKNLRDGAYRKLMLRGFPSSVASSAARIWVDRMRHGEQ